MLFKDVLERGKRGVCGVGGFVFDFIKKLIGMRFMILW